MARDCAVDVLEAVLLRAVPLDEALAYALAEGRGKALSFRDRAFVRLLVMTVLRRSGELDAVLAGFLSKPLPKDQRRLPLILRTAAAQLLVLGTKPHAAISLAVDQCRRDRRAHRFNKLANAVLRRAAAEGAAILAAAGGPQRNIPDWLVRRWQAHYGAETATRIAIASLGEAPLDISVKSDATGWAERLGGMLLSTGSIRLSGSGHVEELPGYADGAWWVQDAAAALPARLLGSVAGMSVLDLCAAPGGKTAELAAAGARVTALDISDTRLGRLRSNLARLGLDAELVAADATRWAPGRTFDAVLLDAPCTATGTIRRHPDILHSKREADVARLGELQRRLLDRAVHLVAPGGLLVYATCSLEPEEGEQQVAALLTRDAGLEHVPITTAETTALGWPPEWVSPTGNLRTLPFHTPVGAAPGTGMDGFFAARIRRRR
ncbi:MAG: transcription antitermination factor NusB [Pseudomonadota bacterium]